ETLRTAILADATATPALTTLAADATTWDEMYLAGLEEAGLLQPDGTVPPLRQDPLIISLTATLAAGILVGPAGQAVRTTGSLTDFFAQIHSWYGDKPGTLAPIDGTTANGNPIPAIPTFDQYNLNLTAPTAFEAFRVYVPWIPFEDRGAGLPADFQINGAPAAALGVDPLDLSRFL